MHTHDPHIEWLPDAVVAFSVEIGTYHAKGVTGRIEIARLASLSASADLTPANLAAIANRSAKPPYSVKGAKIRAALCLAESAVFANQAINDVMAATRKEK